MNSFTAGCFKDGKITLPKHVVGTQKKNVRINDRTVLLLVLNQSRYRPGVVQRVPGS